MAESGIEAKPQRLAGDIGLAHLLERRVDSESVALDTGLGGKVSEPLEFLDELRPAVGVARIVERVDADEDVARARASARPSARLRKIVLRAGT